MNALRQLLNKHKILLAPGVYDGLSARLVEQAGFPLIYASGGAISRSAGLPDLGLLTLTEIADKLQQIVAVTNIPVIADADTGYGNEWNVQRMVQLFEKTGIAGLHLEDQTFPKRCGHLEDKSIIPAEDMIKKIKVAKATCINQDFIIIARTDAIAIEGLDSALERAKLYLSSGADMIFIEAPESLEQIKKIAEKIPEPKLINMFYGGKTPLVPIQELEAMNYQVVIIPSDLQRAAIYQMQKILNVIKKEGDSHTLSSELVSFQEREKIIATHHYLSLANKL